ncbi:hypothetical protein HNY73_005213 [Argiope bruennichi]|uniref:Uncharacterized protein n=1 Tax=Argiope bruennichi TaxID=94029 RepID=A0A8T0FGM7_ARGBR|nr:hypothetical protein HNY73_005213 [Argiope bruennichi]
MLLSPNQTCRVLFTPNSNTAGGKRTDNGSEGIDNGSTLKYSSLLLADFDSELDSSVTNKLLVLVSVTKSRSSSLLLTNISVSDLAESSISDTDPSMVKETDSFSFLCLERFLDHDSVLPVI